MKRTARPWILMTALIFALSGCAIGYQPSGFLGQGYSSRRVDENTWTITFRGNALNSLESVEAYAMRQCADVTLAAGYTYFTVLSHNVTPEIDPVAKGIQHVATIMIRGYRGSKPAGAFDANEVLRYQGRTQSLTTQEPAPSPPPNASQVVGPPQLKAGFRDLRWGDPPISGMQVWSRAENAVYLRRTSDELLIDGVPVEAITYEFIEGGLRLVLIDISERRVESLKDALGRRWGPPQKQGLSEGSAWLRWYSPNSGDDDTEAVIDVKQGSGTLLILSNYSWLARFKKSQKSGL